MSTVNPSLDQAVQDVSIRIGKALSSIQRASDSLENIPVPISWTTLVDLIDLQPGEEAMIGALAVLRAMDVAQITEGSIRPTTRSGQFFLGSLGKFLEQSLVPGIPLEQLEANYCSLTETFERARRDNQVIDHAPLNRRRIVNLIIKKRMMRNFRDQDVYLHVYHPKWKAYHLVGLGQKESWETDQILVKKTMEIRLGLEPQDYEINTTFNPPELQLSEISRTSGALTEYTYRVVFVQSISPELAFDDLMKAGKGPFRWFTLEEIVRKQGDQDEPIMFSTPDIMRHIKETDINVANRLPRTRVKAGDIRTQISIRSELGKRLTMRRLFWLVILPVTTIIALQLILLLWPQIKSTTPVFANLASIATILALIPALYVALSAATSSNRH